MTASNTGPWKMPEEMKPYESFFRELGAFSVEALMNMYGAKCAMRLARAGELATPEALKMREGGCSNPELDTLIDFRAAICNAQVGLTAAFMGAGMLAPQWRVRKPPAVLVPEPPCFVWMRGVQGVPVLDCWDLEMRPSLATGTVVEAWCPAPGGPPHLVEEYNLWLKKFEEKKT